MPLETLRGNASSSSSFDSFGYFIASTVFTMSSWIVSLLIKNFKCIYLFRQYVPISVVPKWFGTMNSRSQLLLLPHQVLFRPKKERTLITALPQFHPKNLKLYLSHYHIIIRRDPHDISLMYKLLAFWIIHFPFFIINMQKVGILKTDSIDTGNHSQTKSMQKLALTTLQPHSSGTFRHRTCSTQLLWLTMGAP